MAKLSPVYNWAEDINSIAATGAKVFTYAAGSSTKQTTYTDSAGLVPQSNPIILNARGEPSNPIWLQEGLSYDFVFASSTDTDPPTSPIRTIPDVTGVNDSSITIDQWVASGVTPTYVSATQFTVPGDQTSTFTVGRRVKLLVTAGTVYGFITVSTFVALTTVTVVMDSGTLDSGLNSVQLGLITPDNDSLPILTDSQFRLSQTANKLLKLILNLASFTSSRTVTFPDKDITVAGLDDIAINQTSKLQPFSAALSSNTLIGTLSASNLDYRPTSLNSGSYSTVANGILTLTIPTAASIGLTTVQAGRLIWLVAYNAGTPILCVANSSGGLLLDESNLISPTTISAGATSANVIYSASAVAANSPYRVVGFTDVIWTSGTGYTTLTEFQGSGGQALDFLSSIGNGAWVGVTRTSGVTYYNTTGKPKFFKYISANSVSPQAVTMNIDGSSYSVAVAANNSIYIMEVIPPGKPYSITITAGTFSTIQEMS